MMFGFQDSDILLIPNQDSGDRTQTTLVIPNLRPEDEGVYKCKARNVWGEVEAEFPVKIHGELTPWHSEKSDIQYDD